MFHTMIAASLRWYDAEKQIPARYGLMAFDFSVKTFGLTEAGSSSISPVKIVSISSLLS